MASKSMSKAQLVALYDEVVAENEKMAKELAALRPLLRVIEAQKETIRCQQKTISDLQANGGQLASDLPWDFESPQKEAPQYQDFPECSGDSIEPPSSELPKNGLYVVYSDGVCIWDRKVSAAGGWAAIVVDPDNVETELCGGIVGTTKNRMELIAALRGLAKVPRGAKVKLVSDSQYLINGLQKGWAKSWRKNGWYKSDGKKALNPDLWKMLLELSEQRQMSYEWVQEHSGHRYNERCSQLANSQASV